MKRKVAVIGAGNWGTTICKLIAENLNQQFFFNEIKMYCHPHKVHYEGKEMELAEVINIYKENPIYLPNVKIPLNIKAVSDFSEFDDTDIYIFCIPIEYIYKVSLLSVKSGAMGINLCKGLTQQGSNLETPSEFISRKLNIKCCTLMGPNIAGEIAMNSLSETTIGIYNKNQEEIFRELFEKPYFRLKFIEYSPIIEVYGALKNVISIAVGIIDYLIEVEYRTEGFGVFSNTKALVLRLGIKEMLKFADGESGTSGCLTFMESCGIGDLVVSCSSGRNFKRGRVLAEYLIKEKDKTKVVTQSDSNSQHLQGFSVLKTLYEYLLESKKLENFPLITVIYKICNEDLKIDQFLSFIAKINL